MIWYNGGMADVFSPRRLRRPWVPAGWEPVLVALRDFEALGVGSADAPQHLPALMAAAGALHEPKAVDDVTPADAARCACRAALYLAELHDLPTRPLVDTTRSRALAAFGAAFAAGRARAQALAEAAAARPGVGAASLAAEVRADAADARRKLALAQWLVRRYGLGDGDRAAARRLLADVYPDAPVTAAETDVVVTAGLTFFCLPIEADRLAVARPVPAAAHVWAARVNSVTESVQAHFPAFSPLDSATLAPGLVAGAAAALGVGQAEARAELARTFTVLPREQAEKYLVHDAWGHGPQAALLRFDDVYRRMGRYAGPIAPGERAGGVRLGDVLGDGEEVEAWLDAELAERLPIVMSAVLAELLADVTEHALARLLPGVGGSSSLAGEAGKLDLTLRDLALLYPRLIAGFDATVVPELADRWRARRAFAAADGIAWRPAADGGLEVTLHALLALHFLALHRAVRAALAAGDLDPDLLVLAAASFFEEDRPRNFWRLDEALALKLVPALRALDGDVAARRSGR